ncbi:TetR family transcriptional regulator [Microbispora sp. NBC_01189]|uniref:TetR/AcrR family transcriptional regulator n=1 Tax=Microbispora sp. NBC_01189 TaxID=2903583 RepID=UPI002E119874|nr:TetR family transcriptional regulator [Microbispora sp. NBC_01189]
MNPDKPGEDHRVPDQDRGSSARRPQQRALRRREALLDAAVDLLGEGGFAAVTHRAVARRAALPLAATSYYFSCRDQLLAEAFALLVERELTRMRAAVRQPADRSAAAVAAALTDVYAADRLRELGLWELYLQAGRDPALQAVARAWTDGCDEIVASALRGAGCPCGRSEVRFVAALLSGLWVEDVVEARADSRDRARDAVTRALTTLQTPAGGDS